MKKISLKILILSGIIFLLSSCMMMGPSHHMTADYEHHNGYYDPVCGHQIETISQDLSWQYNGTVYYFHTSSCMDSFKENPKNYLTPKKQNANNYFLWGLGGVGMAAMMILMIL